MKMIPIIMIAVMFCVAVVSAQTWDIDIATESSSQEEWILDIEPPVRPTFENGTPANYSTYADWWDSYDDYTDLMIDLDNFYLSISGGNAVQNIDIGNYFFESTRLYSNYTATDFIIIDNRSILTSNSDIEIHPRSNLIVRFPNDAATSSFQVQGHSGIPHMDMDGGGTTDFWGSYLNFKTPFLTFGDGTTYVDPVGYMFMGAIDFIDYIAGPSIYTSTIDMGGTFLTEIDVTTGSFFGNDITVEDGGITNLEVSNINVYSANPVDFYGDIRSPVPTLLEVNLGPAGFTLHDANFDGTVNASKVNAIRINSTDGNFTTVTATNYKLKTAVYRNLSTVYRYTSSGSIDSAYGVRYEDGLTYYIISMVEMPHNTKPNSPAEVHIRIAPRNQSSNSTDKIYFRNRMTQVNSTGWGNPFENYRLINFYNVGVQQVVDVHLSNITVSAGDDLSFLVYRYGASGADTYNSSVHGFLPYVKYQVEEL